MRQAVNIDDFREQARRNLPKIFFDYIDGGAFSETTLRANRDDFARWKLVQKALSAGPVQDLQTSLLDWSMRAPIMLGPVGYLGLYWQGGDLAAARAAHAAGIPFCLSTFSIASLGDIRAVNPGDLAFQLYVLDDLTICEELLDTARDLGVDTIFVTVDTAVTSVRERDVRNGFRALTRVSPALAMQMLLKPRWLTSVMRHGVPSARAFDHRPEFGRGALEQAGNLSRRIRKTLSWDDMHWLRKRWPGKLVIKGIMSPDDAAMAERAGFDALVVSNHGGRQLDGAASTISVLPAIRAALSPGFPIIMDGGIRRGADIVKALALGADAVSLGRAYAYAVAAGGQDAVSQAIGLLTREMEICLALMGLNSVSELKRAGPSALLDQS